MNTYFYKFGIIPDYSKIPELLRLMQEAVDCFNEQEIFLLQRNYHEQSVTHSLAMIIHDKIRNDIHYNDMYTDVEYSKGADGNEFAAKYFHNNIVRLDLAVTSRKYDENSGFHNLICAEIKKSSNRRDNAWDNDRERLHGLTSLNRELYGDKLFGYFIGFFIVINKRKMWIENAYDYLGELPKDNTGKIFVQEGRYRQLNFD